MKKQKLKIAVQMFGHLRTFEKCAPYLKKHLLDHYDCDVFMHTWDKVDHNTQTWHNYKVSGQDFSPEELQEKVLATYPIVDIKMESQKPEDLGIFQSLKFKIGIFGVKSMLYSMNESNKLRQKYEQKNSIAYDFVLNIRPDILLLEDFEIQKFFDRLTEQEVNNAVFSIGKNLTPVLNDLRFVGGVDLLFFAKPEVMTTVLSSYPDVLEDIKNYTAVNPFGAEYLFSQNVIIKGFSFYVIDYKLEDKCKIKRNTHTSFVKKLIRLRVNKKYTLCLLASFLPPIFKVDIILFKYKIYLTIGDFNLSY